MFKVSDESRAPDALAPTNLLEIPHGWQELVAQIDLLEELIVDVRDAGDDTGEFVLAELERMLSGRRRTLRAHREGGAL